MSLGGYSQIGSINDVGMINQDDYTKFMNDLYSGMNSASKVILNMINDGKSLDEIKSYCEQTVNDCNSIDKVKNL